VVRAIRLFAIHKARAWRGLGRLWLPKIFFFLVVAGFDGDHHQKGKILGGLAAPPPFWVNRPARATA
jgi:hypothetical protein